MNWYGDNFYPNGITYKDRKNEIINDLTWDDEKSSCKVLDISGKNNIFYFAVEDYDKETGEKSINGGVVLTCMKDKVLMKNIIDEIQGPFYYDCPSRIIDILSPTNNEYAKEWRTKCLEYQQDKSYVNEMKKMSEKDPEALFFVKNTYTCAYRAGGVFRTIAPDAMGCGHFWYNKTTVFKAKDVAKIFALTPAEKQFYTDLQSLMETNVPYFVTEKTLSSIYGIAERPENDKVRLGNLMAAYGNIFPLFDEKIFTPDVVRGILEMDDRLVDRIPKDKVFSLAQEIASAYDKRVDNKTATTPPKYREI